MDEITYVWYPFDGWVGHPYKSCTIFGISISFFLLDLVVDQFHVMSLEDGWRIWQNVVWISSLILIGFMICCLGF